MEAYCKYNPTGNPHWCGIIWGYCQFQTEQFINEHCPIFNEFPNNPIHVSEIDDEILQTYSYLTFYDAENRLVSLGDTAFQLYSGELELEIPYVRYIGRFAFQDCVKLKTLDFSQKDDDFIPVLGDVTAFMMSDRETIVNDYFRIVVPQRLLDVWKTAPNWIFYSNFIKGV